MGWLKDVVKGIGKAIKGVVKGIKNVFKAILEPIGKILNTSWGKAILLAVSVFTFGAALVAGGQAFMTGMAANQGFISSFVQGGQAFVGSLLGTTGKEGVGLAEGGTAGVGEAAIPGIEAAGDAGALASAAVSQGVPGASDLAAAGASNLNAAGNMVNPAAAATGGSLAAGANAVGPTKTLAATGGELAKKAPDSGNWLSRAAGKAWDFAKSDAGQNIIGGALEGQYEGALEESRQKHNTRYDRMWRDPSQTKPITDISAGFRPEIPGIWNRDPTAIANRNIQKYTPSVQYTRAPQGT